MLDDNEADEGLPIGADHSNVEELSSLPEPLPAFSGICPLCDAAKARIIERDTERGDAATWAVCGGCGSLWAVNADNIEVPMTVTEVDKLALSHAIEEVEHFIAIPEDVMGLQSPERSYSVRELSRYVNPSEVMNAIKIRVVVSGRVYIRESLRCFQTVEAALNREGVRNGTVISIPTLEGLVIAAKKVGLQLHTYMPHMDIAVFIRGGE